MTVESQKKSLGTADFVAAAEAADSRQAAGPDLEETVIEKQRPDSNGEDEQLAPLFSPDLAKDFRADWDAVQISFVDDPKEAVRKADELVAQVMRNLAETFSNERASLEGQLEPTERESTENLRVALRRYRSFFQRLLSL